MAVDIFSETSENFSIQQNFVSSVSQHYSQHKYWVENKWPC